MKTTIKQVTRRLAASIAIATALATSGVWADTTATYATGDTSLADGKVLFEYDESDNITKLTMTPGADEKLILTGDSLPFAAGAQMVFPASGGGTNVIANPFTTAGALEFFGPTNMTWGGSDYLPNDGTYVTILENVNLANIVPVEGYGMNGGSAPTYGAEDNLYAPYFIVRDGDKMRFELRHDTRYVFVELVQDGDNIKGRVLLSGRGGTVSADSPIFNYNDGTVTVNGGVNTTYKPYAYEKQKWLVFGARKIELPAISGSGVEVTFDSNALGDTVGEFTSDYPATVKATGRNDMDGAFIVKGDASHPIVYDVAAKYAMPKTIDCYGNAALNFSASGAYKDGVSQYTDTITMHTGTTLMTSGNYPFHYSSGDVLLDGATLSYTAGTTYFNYVTFANGATVDKTGGTINAGYQVDNPKWTVSGTARSTYTGDLSLAAHAAGDNGTEKYLTIEVADTVEGDSTDFLLTGDITAWTDRKNASFIKTGAGTMEVNGTIYTTNRAVRITEGTLLLSKTGATAAEVDFSLQGGTLALAAGTTNALNAVTQTENSIISMGAGASLTIASLTIPEGKTLDIAFAGAVDSRSVKVLDTLDSPTLSRIRLNGRRPGQNEEGYLCPRGFIISVF